MEPGGVERRAERLRALQLPYHHAYRDGAARHLPALLLGGTDVQHQHVQCDKSLTGRFEDLQQYFCNKAAPASQTVA